MLKKSIFKTIPNNKVELSADDEILALKKQLKKSFWYEMAAIWSFVLFASYIGFYLYKSGPVRFAITHQKEVGVFESNYRRVEAESQKAANAVLTSWIESGRIK